MENSEKKILPELQTFEGGIEVFKKLFVENKVSDKNGEPYIKSALQISIKRNKTFVQKLYEQISDDMDKVDYKIASQGEKNPDILYLDIFYMYDGNLAIYNEKQKKVDSLLFEKTLKSIGAGSKLTVVVKPAIYTEDNGDVKVQIKLRELSIAHLEEADTVPPIQNHLTAEEIEAGLS